jgi:hypothetical protein
LDFIDPNKGAKDMSTELWKSFQDTQKIFHDLPSSSKVHVMATEETQRRVGAARVDGLEHTLHVERQRSQRLERLLEERSDQLLLLEQRNKAAAAISTASMAADAIALLRRSTTSAAVGAITSMKSKTQEMLLWTTSTIAAFAAVFYWAMLRFLKPKSGTLKFILLAGTALLYMVVIEAIVMRSASTGIGANTSTSSTSTQESNPDLMVTESESKLESTATPSMDTTITTTTAELVDLALIHAASLLDPTTTPATFIIQPETELLGIWQVRDIHEAHRRYYEEKDEVMVTAIKSVFENVLGKVMTMPIQSVARKEGIAPSGDKLDWFSRTFYKPGEDGEMHPGPFRTKKSKM